MTALRASVTSSPAAQHWPQVRVLFERLLDAEAFARAAMLAEAESADAQVAREARALYDQHAAEERLGGGFLAEAATLASTVGPRAESAAPTGARSGK